MNKIVLKNIAIPILYVATLLFVYVVSNYITLEQIAYFMIGSILATILLIGDQFVFSKYYNEEKNDTYLATRSTLFLICFIPLAVFVVTSSGSLVGLGLILTLAVTLFIEMWALRHTPTLFREKFLSQIATQYTQRTIDYIVIFVGVFILFLHLLVLR